MSLGRRLLLVAMTLLPGPLLAEETLTLGVFAYRPEAVMEARYRPLADYLGERLPDHRVELEVMSLDEIEEAISHRRLDLLMTNPSHYLEIRSRNSLTGALATVINAQHGQAVSSLGGTMIKAAGNAAIQELDDLAGRRIAMPGRRFLGGYQTHALELMDAGIDPRRDIEPMIAGSHDAVVAAVLAGEAEAGFVRTGILEGLIAEGELAPGQLEVINPQRLASFPFAVSTRLYPEWPFVVMPQLVPETVRRIAVALFTLEPEHPAARAAMIAGFAPPQDYLPVENLARRLRLPPFDAVPDFTWHDIWQRYAGFLLGLAAAGALVAALLALLARRNRQLRQQRERLSLLAGVFTHSHEGVMITAPDGELLEVNDAFSQITGYPRGEAVGRNASLLGAGRHPQAFYADFWQQLKRTGHWDGEVWNRRKNGEVYPQRLTISAVTDGAGEVQRYVGLLSDITQLKAHQRALTHAAQHDALTGLPNRALLADRLRVAMAQADRSGQRLAVVFIDLDGFKAVNDTHGHDMGDRLLVALAERMQGELRASDTLARLGGDEFVVVLLDLASDEEGERVIDRLLAATAAPVEVAGRRLQVSASLGVAYYDAAEGGDEDQLLRHADQAMYRAKEAGKHCYRVYEAPCQV
ncbi:putative diguanylate cyclase YegE [Halomonas sp. THAF5a]|uniref:diguanylate cyclase domain-containing protein n=1 Tax=Halomonas sp. THAF5a TaxID=2587844 RepID=UPI0012A9B269|nr:diguanylate cyclase [Halomonas sp. THAF5a]QFU00151.1 putative diguanylate cyclase YegE [Halomonas sp. THAF5a]